MKMNRLGRSDIEVSEICLGSMTWGTQNSEAEGHAQIDYALAQGVNFIDTAELYPVNPISGETQGRTEEIIGTWFQNGGQRENLVLATKVAGNGPEWIQGGIDISPTKIHNSLEASLRRLQTDYVDLYQLHWPNRGSYAFRQNWTFDPSRQKTQATLDHIHEVLECLAELVQQGKVRAIGLSNESCWGTAQFLRIAEQFKLPRVVSIQNEYSLLYRPFDLDLAELAHHEQLGLLPYSPLSCGLLTGKYTNGRVPEGSRMDITRDLYGRVNNTSMAAVDAYLEVARRHGLDLSQLAIAFCNQRPFIPSTIIGATSVEQLANSLGAADVTLTEEVLKDIDEVYRRFPMPY